ncbi:MAG TPA: hypothetical protein VNL71_11370, partial [Chloroflexota bacterium]|nr:hypothetical protein [Chloroflexota bacterium]
LIALRRAEDIAAATLLGAHVEHADLLDGLYRRDRDGNHLYADKAGPFGARQTDDIPLSARITALVQARTVSRHVTCHLPLAIGGHVDHLIVFDTAALLAAEGYKVCYYEDIPYAENPRLVRQRSAAFQGWNPILDEFNEPHLAAKLNACAYYRSQLWSLFGGETAMRAKLAAHAQRTGTGDLPFAERSWYLRKPT